MVSVIPMISQNDYDPHPSYKPIALALTHAAAMPLNHGGMAA